MEELNEQNLRVLAGKVARLAGIRKGDGCLNIEEEVFWCLKMELLGDSCPEPQEIDPMARLDPTDEFPLCEFDLSPVNAEIHMALTAAEFANRAGISTERVKEFYDDGKILGLERGKQLVFPAWQIDQDGQLHDVLEQILKNVSSAARNPTQVLVSLITGTRFCDGRSIKDQLISNETDQAILQSRMIGSERSG